MGGRPVSSRVLLFSSGIDSLIAWHFVNKPKCLHITGHSRYSESELDAIERFRSIHPEMEIQVIGGLEWLRDYEQLDATLPGRNGLFALIASYHGDAVYLVAQRGEQDLPDRSPSFFAQTSNYLSVLHGRTVEVSPVFPTMTKQDMVSWYLEKGLPTSELLSTYSCFSVSQFRCGQCSACARTAVALEYSGVLPDDFFQRNIWEWAGWREYVVNLMAGKYESRRTRQWLKVLNTRGLLNKNI